MRKRVVLPLPLGPEQAEDLAGAYFEAESVERETFSVAVRQAVEHDRREGGPRCGSGGEIGRSLTERCHFYFPVALSIMAVSSSGRYMTLTLSKSRAYLLDSITLCALIMRENRTV